MSQIGVGLKLNALQFLNQNEGDGQEDSLLKQLTERSNQPLIQFSEKIITCIYNSDERVSIIGEYKIKCGMVNMKKNTKSSLKHTQ